MGEPAGPNETDITRAEWGLVDIAVKHGLRNYERTLREYLRDDARQVAAVAIFLLRPAVARRPEGERAPYTLTSLGHVLHRWLKHELAWRKLAGPQPAAGSEDEPTQGLADERETDWDDRIANSLFEAIGDEPLTVALRTLSPLEQQILNLYYFCCLPDREIADCLNAHVKAVQSRRERAIEKLQKRLGVKQRKRASSPWRKAA